MIKVERIEVWGFEHAIRGMRNPLNSWDRSDTFLGTEYHGVDENGKEVSCKPDLIIGENDLALMKKLYDAGQPHRKYLRQIFVSMDITAPLYWWKQFDTYRVGVTTNSCSTMHKIQAKEFTREDFSCEHLDLSYSLKCLDQTIHVLNINREEFLETKDKRHWWNMVQLLPSSYNQKRTVTMSYENVMNIMDYRQGHKLDEWNDFCEILAGLPVIEELRDEVK